MAPAPSGSTTSNKNKDKKKKPSGSTSSNQNKEKKEKPVKHVEYNPRYKGYIFIILTSLVNLSSISNIDKDADFDGIWGLTLSFPCFTFAACSLILFLDRTQLCTKFDYTKACNGKFEGCSLLFFTIWSIVGTGYTTQSSGIAYYALNVYFSSWLVLFSCIYTLNLWSTAKDILSIAELTGVSATLKSWYILFIASLVVFGSSVDIYSDLVQDTDRASAALGQAFGIASSIVSFGFILVHYKFLQFCSEGGWVEFGCACCLVLMWIVGVAILTEDDGIAATIVGSGCRGRVFDSATLEDANCTVTLVEEDKTPMSFSCLEGIVRQIPGSNLYLASWTCLLSSLNVTFRWKAAQALQFAQARDRKAMERARIDREGALEDDDLDDDNLDEFVDAEY